MAQKSISIEKLLKYLSVNGTIATAEWYACFLEMPIKKAQYTIAQRIFKEYDEDCCGDFDDSVIDITLCRYLWQRYIEDEQVMEIIERAFLEDKFDRKMRVSSLLDDLNIRYPRSEEITNAIFFVAPELRTAPASASKEVIQKIRERLFNAKVSASDLSLSTESLAKKETSKVYYVRDFNDADRGELFDKQKQSEGEEEYSEDLYEEIYDEAYDDACDDMCDEIYEESEDDDEMYYYYTDADTEALSED